MKSKLWILLIAMVIGFVVGCDTGNNLQSGTLIFTVTFDSAGGSAVLPQAVTQGGLAIEPVVPVRFFTPNAGLYAFAKQDLPGYVFAGWYNEGTSFDFGTPITAAVSLVAQWMLPAEIPPSIAGITANDVAAAIAYVNTNPGAFTLVIDEDVFAAPQMLSVGGVELTIIGLGEPREIRLNAQGSLFNVGSTQQMGVNLTLGNNITLVGLRNGRHGATVDNNSNVVWVYDDGIFTMLEGSRVTGNTAPVSAINIQSAGSFVMLGGEITGNVSTGTGAWGVGGLRLFSNSSATLAGGRITENTNVIFGDVVVGSTTNLTLSGSAEIGTVTIASRPQDNVFITVVPGWMGNVNAINLWVGVFADTMQGVIDLWSDRTVLQASEGHTITPADVARFQLGNFIGSNVADPQAISPTHRISNSGANIGTLVFIGD